MRRFLPSLSVLLALPSLSYAADVDAVDASGRKAGAVTVERAGDPLAADGKTWTPFTIVVRSSAQAKGRFFGTILLDGGRAGDCTWYVEVDAGASKRIEKACRQRRPFESFSATAKVDLPEPRREE